MIVSRHTRLVVMNGIEDDYINLLDLYLHTRMTKLVAEYKGTMQATTF